MSYTKRAIRGIGMVLAMYAFGLIFAFLFRVLLARKLSVADYGLYYALFALFSTIYIFRDLGMQSALAKFLPEWIVRKSASKVKLSVFVTFAYSLFFSVLGIVLFYFLGDFVGTSFFKQVGIGSLVFWFAVAFGLMSFESIITAVFTGYQRIFQFSLIGIIRPALLLVFTFGFFYVFAGVKAAVFASILSSIVVLLLSSPLWFKLIPWEAPLKWDSALVGKFGLFGIQIFVASIGGMLLQYTDSLMLTYFRSVEDVGLYNAALPISNLILYLSSAVSTVALPLFSELLAKRLKVRVRNAMQLLYKYVVVIALPAVAIIYSFPDLILRVLFGENYVFAAVPLQILVWGALLSALAGINFTYFNASGKPLLVTKVILMATAVNVVLNYLLIPLYGIVGAAVATASSLAVMLVINTIYLHRFLHVQSPFWAWIKNLFCCAAMIGVIIAFKKILVMNVYLESIAVLAVAGLVYVALIFLVGVVRVGEIKDLLRQSL